MLSIQEKLSVAQEVQARMKHLCGQLNYIENNIDASIDFLEVINLKFASLIKDTQKLGSTKASAFLLLSQNQLNHNFSVDTLQRIQDQFDVVLDAVDKYGIDLLVVDSNDQQHTH